MYVYMFTMIIIIIIMIIIIIIIVIIICISCLLKDGNPVALDAWVKSHKPNDRELVQGLKGDATYLVSTADGVKDFGINAVCTHLGCVVPWNVQANRFICPCHGLELSHRKCCDLDSWPDT